MHHHLIVLAAKAASLGGPVTNLEGMVVVVALLALGIVAAVAVARSFGRGE
jgi:hypothetical protein